MFACNNKMTVNIHLFEIYGFFLYLRVVFNYGAARKGRHHQVAFRGTICLLRKTGLLGFGGARKQFSQLTFDVTTGTKNA
jgi:hypothetical protein